jgi:hypothetical protein
MSRISRRDFARTAGVVVGAALLPRRGRAAEPAPAAPPAPPAHAPKLSAAGKAEADARVQVIMASYGARLSPAERADLQRLSADAQEMLDQVRAYPLDDADEPAHLFRAPRRRR